MITPRQFDIYPDTLVNIAQAFEEEIITRICRELSIDRRLSGDLVGQGLTQQEITEWLSSFNDATQIEVEALYSRIYDQVVDDEQYLYDYFERDSILRDNVTKQVLIRADIAQTQNLFRNLTQSSGFVYRGVFTPTARIYQTVLDDVVLKRQAGLNARQAVREVVIELTNKGLEVVEYESGHKDQIDVAVRRATVTGMHQISEKVITVQQRELGANLTEMSAHRDARDQGTGFVNHKSWQGKVYWVYEPEGDYPSFEEVGEGDVQGYRGANCRHSRRLYIEGVTERQYTDKELANIDVEPIEFDGKTYNAYEATQRQRQIERYIRQYKRRIIGFEAAGIGREDAIYRRTSRILAGWNQEYKDFSAAANLREQTERARIIGFGRGEAARARAAARV